MRVKLLAALLLLGLGSSLLAPLVTAQTDDIAVVASSGNPTSNISLADLRKILAGTKRSWPGGQAVRLVTRGPGCRERLVLLKFLGMSEAEYKQYWTAQVYRGEADVVPLVVPSVGMQKEALMAFPGAVSLVSAKDVKPGMKIIRVDGLLPGEAGYPIR
ncbi:MAG: hypothetical protein WB919_00970 [Candidatus Sulfotelmatobacter sp.]